MAQAQTRIHTVGPAVALVFLTVGAVLVVSAMFADLMNQISLASAFLLGGCIVVGITFLTAMFFILRDIFTS